MNPIDALKLLDTLAAQVPLNRADHERVKMAVHIVHNAIANGPAKDEAA
jgi:hypothetical protein